MIRSGYRTFLRPWEQTHNPVEDFRLDLSFLLCGYACWVPPSQEALVYRLNRTAIVFDDDGRASDVFISHDDWDQWVALCRWVRDAVAVHRSFLKLNMSEYTQRQKALKDKHPVLHAEHEAASAERRSTPYVRRPMPWENMLPRAQARPSSIST